MSASSLGFIIEFHLRDLIGPGNSGFRNQTGHTEPSVDARSKCANPVCNSECGTRRARIRSASRAVRTACDESEAGQSVDRDARGGCVPRLRQPVECDSPEPPLLEAKQTNRDQKDHLSPRNYEAREGGGGLDQNGVPRACLGLRNRFWGKERRSEIVLAKASCESRSPCQHILAFNRKQLDDTSRIVSTAFQHRVRSKWSVRCSST